VKRDPVSISTVLAVPAVPWAPTKRQHAMRLKSARGRALQRAARWARNDKDFLRDLTRLVKGSKPGQHPLWLIAEVATLVELLLHSGERYTLTFEGERSVFVAACQYRPDLTARKIARLYHEGVELGMVDPTEN